MYKKREEEDLLPSHLTFPLSSHDSLMDIVMTCLPVAATVVVVFVREEDFILTSSLFLSLALKF